MVQKNNTPNYCLHLRQILTDAQNSFTDTLSRKFAIKISLQIQPHVNGVATVYISLKKFVDPDLPTCSWDHAHLPEKFHQNPFITFLRNITSAIQLKCIMG